MPLALMTLSDKLKCSNPHNLMQPSPNPARGAVILLMIGAASLLSSCLSRPANILPLQTVSEQRIVLHEGQFKEVNVTGSNIPVLVSNLPSTRPLPSNPEVYTISPEAFQEMVRRGDAQSPYRH